MKTLKTTRKMEKKVRMFGCYLAAALLGILTGTILTVSLMRPQGLNTPKLDREKPVKTTGILKTIEVKANETPCDYDPITYIRCKGEQLGVSNHDIMTLIRIARCESGLRENAFNVNTNKTLDGGIFQINSVHKMPLKDVFDFKKNIDYGYKLFLDQGFGPWSASKRCWNK